MDSSLAARRVSMTIVGLPLKFHDGRGTYSHIGATLADSVLQAGLNYRTVVLPRVKRVLRDYPNARTTSAFYAVVQEFGASSVLCWKHEEKPRRLIAILDLLQSEAVETEWDLATFLNSDSGYGRLLALRGVGFKTVDYMKMLVGCRTVAVDRHIRRLFAIAEVPNEDYQFVKRVLLDCAESLGIRADVLDAALWDYFSKADLPFASDLS